MANVGQLQDRLRVLLVSPLGPGGRGGIDRLNDLIFETVGNIPELDLDLTRLVTRGERSLLVSPFFTAHALFKLLTKARKQEVDLLHIHLSTGGSFYRKVIVGTAARHLEIPYVVHIHADAGIFDLQWRAAPGFLDRSIKRLLGHSTAIIVLGHYCAQVLIERLPTVADKVIVFPNATTYCHTIRNQRDQDVRISFCGKLGRVKGTPQLIEALAKLAYRNDWAATIAGDGDVEQSRSLARERGIANRIEIPGWLDSAAVADVFRQSGIFVLPSSAEGLPMAILEAFACGAAVIATPVGAVPEVIDHERNGLLVPVGDVNALADALRRLLDDPIFRQSLGEAARRDHAEKYEIGGYVRRLAKIWRKAARSQTA